MVSEPNHETQGGPLAFWRYMEGSLQTPDILYIGQTLYKGIPVNVPAALTVLPLGDPRRPGPEQWDFNITTPRKEAIRPCEAQIIYYRHKWPSSYSRLYRLVSN